MATTRKRKPKKPTEPSWSIDAARAMYNIEGWGAGFFDINDSGHVIVRPDKSHPERVVAPRPCAATRRVGVSCLV